ncbi:hypothetical protein Pla52n_26230 [Stieleria varia]|uniref:Uncharacterized protein n=1 Tax=Stieleria varia TaxID=2528005 RepID=A0A5C6AYV1_9BACT|nr:hypothetical protein Pla52n_26230 [Stieleria varia]
MCADCFRASPAQAWTAQRLVLCLLGLHKFMALLPTQPVAPGEPQELAVGLRRIVVPAHG